MVTFPGSLSEGAGSPQGLTEGVSSDGSSVPTVYPPVIINSVIFERLRSSGYTPSASHSLSSSLREGAGNGPYHSTCRPEAARLRAIFIAPTQLKSFLHFAIHRTTLPQSRIRSTAPSEREPGGCVPFIVPPRSRNVAGDFHRPYEILHFTVCPCGGAGGDSIRVEEIQWN